MKLFGKVEKLLYITDYLCYKTSMWTDFRVRTKIRYRTVVLLLVYNRERACDLEVM